MNILFEIANQIIDCFKRGNKLMIAGNGGSAAMAQHMAAEFINGFENHNRAALPAIALTTDTSVLTSIANDSDFVQVFCRQVEALGQKGDILILFSTSDPMELNIKHIHSYNLEFARQEAIKKGMTIIWFPRQGNSTAKIQEYQFKLMHDVVREVEKFT